MHWRYERERGLTEGLTATTEARAAGSSPAQPQVEKPPTMPAGPNSSMPSQGAGWARASLPAGCSHGRRRLAHHGGGTGRSLAPLAGKDLRRLARHRPVPGCSAQPCGQLATTTPQTDQAPRHSSHGTGGGVALHSGDLPAPTGRPDKRLYQVRQHRGSGPRRAD